MEIHWHLVIINFWQNFWRNCFITGWVTAPVKKSKADAAVAADPLKIIRKPSSKDRRDHIFAAGKAKGLEEGTEIGRALGLEEGIKEGTQLAALEVASLRATNDALQKRLADTIEQSNGIATKNLLATQRLADTLEQSNGIATENLLATQTAAELVVELQREEIWWRLRLSSWRP